MGKISLKIWRHKGDKPVNRRRDLRKQGLVQLGLSLVIIILLNIISSFLFTPLSGAFLRFPLLRWA